MSEKVMFINNLYVTDLKYLCFVKTWILQYG